MTGSVKLLQALAVAWMVAAPPAGAAPRLPTVEAPSALGIRISRPPTPGSGPRITFPKRLDTPSAPQSEAAWFWTAISAARAAADPARLAQVRAALGPRLTRQGAARGADDVADRVLRAHGPALLREARRANVSPTLLLAVIATESAGRADAISPKGALGLMQLMPATARRFGVGDPTDPGQNIAGGARYLSFLLDRFDGDAVLALAAYNAGEGAVDRHGGVPPYAETRAYVPRALAGFETLRARCIAPPAGPRDPCLFKAAPG
jgi:soluble lytic murein transglycosylase-like protein